MRAIRFQFSLMLMGMTGWIFNTFRVRSYGPLPKAVLFWSGTLISEATGFCAAFASASVSPAASGFASSDGTGLPCGSCAKAGSPDRTTEQSSKNRIARNTCLNIVSLFLLGLEGSSCLETSRLEGTASLRAYRRGAPQTPHSPAQSRGLQTTSLVEFVEVASL